MTSLTYSVPTPGTDSNYVAAPELVNALTQIQTVLNPLITDSGWVNFTLENDWANGSPALGQGTPGYRQIGRLVYLRGTLASINNPTSTTFASAPAVAPAHVFNAAVAGNSEQQVKVDESGNFSVGISGPGAPDISLDGIAYLID